MTFGIDFGTSNCVVARWDDGGADVVPFDSASVSADWYGTGAERVFPSVFGVSNGARDALFGWKAKLFAEDTAEAVKRLLVGHSQIEIGGHRFGSTDVATLLFRAIRAGMAASGAPLDAAVVTVPAKSTGQARFRTRDAARRAGIKTLSLINEPTAAAMAYVDLVRDDGTFLVYDWGGGTVDATILEYADGVLVEKAASGRSELGGIDIDASLKRILLERFSNSGSWTPVERRRFALDVERAKITLSSDHSVAVLSPRGDDVITIERRELEELVAGLTERSLEPVIEVLGDLSLEPDEIDAVIMVGGTSRMPIARRMLQELMGQPPVAQELLDPLTAVGQGAAFAAAALSGVVDDVVSVVTANALGTRVADVAGESFSPIVHRNSSLPIKGSKTYKPNAAVVSRIKVDVWEGDPDRALSDPYNQLLKQLEFDYPEPTPREDARFGLDFTYLEDGTVAVRAEILKTGHVLFDGPIDIFGMEERDTGFAEEIQRIFAGAESVDTVDSSEETDARPPVDFGPSRRSHAKGSQPESRPLPRVPAPPKRAQGAVVLVVDGSNLAWAGVDKVNGAVPSVQNLQAALDQLLHAYPAADVKVVVDANFRHVVDESERAVVDRALQSGRWIQPPAGTLGAGDALVLAVANATQGLVVSNDSYREFQEQYPWLRSGERLLGATPAGSTWVFLKRKPPAPRRTEAQPVIEQARAALPDGWEASGWRSQAKLAGPRRRSSDTFGPVSDNYYMSPLDSK